jgi:N-acylneuraminate cytidylyltransferase
LAYTIAAARESGLFAEVLVSTDSPRVAEVARHYGARVPFLRPVEMAADLSPDIDWVRHALGYLRETGAAPSAYALLRPTSPFRTADTIRRAWNAFRAAEGADSLRAVEPCAQHPGKMWVVEDGRLAPLLKDGPRNPPWHSSPYQSLPRVYVQNASLEIAWSRTALEKGSLAGEVVAPFFTEGREGFDINRPEDWWLAEEYVRSGEARLPRVPQSPFELSLEEAPSA